MSLTKGDLKSIRQVVLDTVQPMIEDAKEDIKIDVAAGFAEVHEKFAEVHKQFAEVHQKIDRSVTNLGGKIDHVDSKLSVKDRKLENTVERVDKLEIVVGKLKQRTA